MSNSPLINPWTKGLVFGLIPALRLGGIDCPESEVFLPRGKHIGPNHGFGARHIWAEHRQEMALKSFTKEEDVPLYVLGILRSGTPLFFEDSSWHKTKLMAVRSATGTAILEFRDRREGAIWSVVTAYSGTKAHGTRVGTVR